GTPAGAGGPRRGHLGGRARRLLRPQARRRYAEMIAGRGFSAEHAGAPFDNVEVDLEDTALAHDRLDHEGDRRFLRLAPPRALARQKEVLGELLRDRRAAVDDPAFLHVLLVGLLDRLPIEPLVLEKLRVFRRHYGALEMQRDTLVGNPLVAERRARILLPHPFQPS